MSFTAPSPYKSRLFNFLNRQTRQWKEKSDRALRYFQVAATWSVQVLLYPVYLLFQSAQFVTHQLQQAVTWETPSQSQTLPPADTPIRRVLKAVKQVKVEQQAENVPLRTARSAPVAIATLLETRNLVLVNDDNQTLDILTPQQQQQLHKEMSFELVKYWEQQRLLEENAESRSFIPTSEERVNLFSPVRLLQQVNDWVQTSAIGTALNFEARSQELKVKSQELKRKHQALSLKTENIAFSDASSRQPEALGEAGQPTFIVTLDRAVADLEAGRLAPVSQMTASIVHRGEEFVQMVKGRFSNTHPVKSDRSPVDLENTQADQFNLQALIQAAIDYFFADRRSQFPWQKTSVIGGNKQLESPIDEDPWLTQNELFPNSLPGTRHHSNAQLSGKKATPSAGSLPGSQQPTSIGNNIYNRIQPYVNSGALLSPPDPEADWITHSRNSRSIQPNRHAAASAKTPSPSSVLQPQAVGATGVSQPSDSYQGYFDASSDWIETEATPVGYVKHPLEQVLEWLDRAMLWLEGAAIKVWNWVQRSLKINQ